MNQKNKLRSNEGEQNSSLSYPFPTFTKSARAFRISPSL